MGMPGVVLHGAVSIGPSIPTLMDVDTSFGYSDGFGQRGLQGMSIAGLPGRLSDGITINEPEPDLILDNGDLLGCLLQACQVGCLMV